MKDGTFYMPMKIMAFNFLLILYTSISCLIKQIIPYNTPKMRLIKHVKEILRIIFFSKKEINLVYSN